MLQVLVCILYGKIVSSSHPTDAGVNKRYFIFVFHLYACFVPTVCKDTPFCRQISKMIGPFSSCMGDFNYFYLQASETNAIFAVGL